MLHACEDGVARKKREKTVYPDGSLVEKEGGPGKRKENNFLYDIRESGKEGVKEDVGQSGGTLSKKCETRKAIIKVESLSLRQTGKKG